MEMHFRRFVLEGFGIVLLGVLLVLLDVTTALAPALTAWLVVLVALAKTSFWVRFAIRRIIDVAARDIPFHQFLVFMVINVLMVTFSFGVDFFCLIWVAPESFTGIPADFGVGLRLFECYYFSVLNFTNFGYGEILPRTIPGKLLVMVEDLLSFFTIILILSDFVSLKESIQSSDWLRRRKDES